jgi:hypothetical protein
VIQTGSDGTGSILRTRTVFGSLDSVERLVVQGRGGRNTLIVDNSAGAIHFPLGIHFDGSRVILQGEGTTAVSTLAAPGRVITRFGATPQETQEILFGNLAFATPLVQPENQIGKTTFLEILAPSENLIVQGTDADNTINYRQSPQNAAWGRVTVDDTLIVDFANMND